MSSTPWDVPALVETINRTIKHVGDDNEEARLQCLDATRSLSFALEIPSEAIVRHGWAEATHHTVLRVCVDLDVFRKLDERNGEAKSSSEVAHMTGADPALMGRLLKHLAAMGSIYESGADQYIPTPFSKALRDPLYRDAYPVMFDIAAPPGFALSEYLSRSGYKNPTDPINCAFQLGHGTKETFFEWLSNRPERSTQFQNHMAGYRTGRPYWASHDFYPVQKNLAEGAKTGDDAVFLVDIAGGKGRDLQELHQKHPNLPGKLVLQEVKGVLEEAKAEAVDQDGKIVFMEHDFFTKQPLIGARAYYMHFILHDWPDAKAHEILTSIKPAMAKGYSKLLINENVIPDKGAHYVATGLDMIMMSLFASCERTEQNWRVLLESAGYKIIKIWTYKPGTESIIEAELA